jgi:hypothetical protein
LLSAPALSSPPTFSITTSRGRSAAMAGGKADQIPLLVPCRRPARPPAQETFSHGNPPARMPTGGTAAQSTAVMSPRFGTDG